MTTRKWTLRSTLIWRTLWRGLESRVVEGRELCDRATCVERREQKVVNRIFFIANADANRRTFSSQTRSRQHVSILPRLLPHRRIRCRCRLHAIPFASSHPEHQDHGHARLVDGYRRAFQKDGEDNCVFSGAGNRLLRGFGWPLTF